MENIKSVINAFFSLFLGAVLIGVITDGINKWKKNDFPSKSYVYEGFTDYSIEQLGDSFFSKSIKLPKSIALKDRNAIVQRPQTAAKIGISILVSKYGKEFITSQYPFQVFLVNGKIWMIRGTRRNKQKTPSCIYIQKADSKILKIQK